MRILIAEDEPLSRRLLVSVLTQWGYEVAETSDGLEAWSLLQAADGPRLAILDWMMPGLDGPEICRLARQAPALQGMYLILLTARGSKDDLVAGLQAGANDFVAKPFDAQELRARIQVGVRMVQLQAELARRVQELEAALAQVRQLQGLLPICCYCKRIRDDQDYWHQVEAYISQHSGAQFSHSICPECYDKFIRPELQRLRPRT